jgi:hypothetical protein
MVVLMMQRKNQFGSQLRLIVSGRGDGNQRGKYGEEDT